MGLDDIGQIKQVLDTAKKLVTGDRRESYGSPRESFKPIAALWSAYLGYAVSSHDVAMLMILLKMARQKNKHKEDNLVDICGYASLATILNESTEECNEERSNIQRHDNPCKLILPESVRYMVHSGPCPSNCQFLLHDPERAVCCSKFPKKECPKYSGVCSESESHKCS